ncbi:hypothetical protein CHLRE_05g236500v5 [Chlamydomonas reinhardtii]|uniref:ceramidase n=1 Tax=Chlamydomonas reinhardtii TaxID=3055 RepID=A0A2K3DSU8_CHLRE|nr:uncharacterized protein CHLRE_05g236500v5 [Chlamydomonas reinhardtii]PNW83601.1 hypothetical protein CHLRE_05g236500v5 [Chlamydomonas reinhardtii]
MARSTQRSTLACPVKALLLAVAMSYSCCRADYLVGVGMGDITGPVADVNLMGYAQPLQTARGLHTRLFARAFMFADAAYPRRRFVYVSADACMASQLVSLRVVQALQAEYGKELYGFDNVAISGTHTHASPAGFLQYLLYDITSLGFVTQSFEAMVEGILVAIRSAHGSLQPGRVLLAAGRLAGGSINRSPTAYAANPQEERDMYDSDVDTDITLLRLEGGGPAVAGAAAGAAAAVAGRGSSRAAAVANYAGLGLGALSWFAVHCTSLNNTNRLVSGDNKAAASLMLERWAAEAEARAQAAEAEAEAQAETPTGGALGATAGGGSSTSAGGQGLGQGQAGRQSGGGGGGQAESAASSSPAAAAAAAWAAAQSAAAAAAAASAALGLRLEDLTSPDPEQAAAAAGGRAARPFNFHLLTSSSKAAEPAGEEGGGAGVGGAAGGGGERAQAARAGGRTTRQEQQQQRPLRFSRGFVAAVAQAAVGDTSPNTAGAYCLDTGLPCEPAHSTCNGRNELCHGRGPAWPHDRASAALIGGRQAEAARRLYLAAGEQAPLTGPLAYRSSFIDMANTSVAPVNTSSWAARGGRTCPPAMGMSFAAGTTDGPGAFDFTQGDTRGPPLWRLVARLLTPPSPQQVACQAPKPILLDTGQITVPYPWQPRITQVSLLRLGHLLVACLPGEPTTMAGRRIKRALAARFAAAASPGEPAPVVVVSGLTGTYSSYITTWEEYQVQRYEGASTLYGPHTLDAYIQELLALADSMLAGTPHDPTAAGSTAPPDLQSRQWALLPPVVLDAVPPGAVFGQVTQQPGRDSYAPGQVVNATFRAANPRNNLHANGSFLTVERWQQSKSRARHHQQQPPLQEVKGQGIRQPAGEQQQQQQQQGGFAKALGVLWQASGARLWRLLSRSTVQQQQPAAVAEVAVAAVAGTRGGDAATAGAAAGASLGGAQAGGVGAGATAATAAGVQQDGEEVWFAAQSPCSSGRSLPAATAGAAAAEGTAAEGTAAEGAAEGVADGPAAEGAAEEEGEWVAVHDDRDWVTRFHWDRHAELSPLSYATLVWEVPPETPPGTYRLRYRGDAKLLSGAVRPFEGCSAAFRVEEEAAAAAVEENDG